LTEPELKNVILERYPDLANLRPLGWSGGYEVPSNKIVGVIVVSRLKFDGWKHLPIRDDELRALAWDALPVERPGGRYNCKDEDAILCLAVIQ
jgi:hypothetical protein